MPIVTVGRISCPVRMFKKTSGGRFTSRRAAVVRVRALRAAFGARASAAFHPAGGPRERELQQYV